jgi:CubicO group peptidase (beta-lactamase class C family)
MSDYLLLGLLIEKVSGVGYATAVQRELLSSNGDARIVPRDAQLPPPLLAAPDKSADRVPDGHCTAGW